MLVLSRRKDETIVIGEDIRITIVDIRGDSVRLGITAPKSVPVYRQEIYEAIQRENLEAAQAKAEGLDAFKGFFPAKPGEKPPAAPPAPSAPGGGPPKAPEPPKQGPGK
jgi:carbon storage regulator